MEKPELHPHGWGDELWMVNNDAYCGKIMTLKKDKKCSIHYHKMKLEDFYVFKGKMLVEYMAPREGNDQELLKLWDSQKMTRIMSEGEAIHIPRLALHRFTGIAHESMFIEISTTHREEDSYRILRGD